MFVLNCIVDWRPVDDPVLSGVTQTCLTKLEGEVMNDTCFHSANQCSETGFSMKQS